MSLLSVDQAREAMLARLVPAGTERIPLAACANRVLAADIVAVQDLPLFDNSSMDGFAVRAEDTSGAAPASRVTLRVVADIPAGSTPTMTLAPGEAARIMTGAPIPQGADAVIPVEETDFHDRSPGTAIPPTISFEKTIKSGENVRRRGMDVRIGDTVLRKGDLLRAQDIGLLAMLGFAEVEVHKKPLVALLSSGDELVEADAPLETGKIHDSNSYMLASLVESAGAEVLMLGIAKDTYESVHELLERAVSRRVDLLLSSAGVSVGAFDFVKEVVESNGSLTFWRVNMRPGKPLAFGEYRNTPFIGLPGNPVSAFVGFEVFVRDAIGKLRGFPAGDGLKARVEPHRSVRVISEETIISDGRESYLRAVVREEEGRYLARLTGHQGSGNLLSLVQANALLIIPAGVKCVPAGREVNAWLL
ncbi:MAG: molybdopterin molybdotransferase MoeA [Chloroflexi bacterium]|nr:molybdopterin molybdotransferase MoeA [Chloroflexota bacterium]